MPLKTSSASAQPAPNQSSILQVTSTISLVTVQTLMPPLPDETSDSHSRPSYTARLLTASSQTKAPLFLIVTPLDRATAAADGSALCMLTMQSWGQQVDELVSSGSYVEALTLLDTVDPIMMPDKACYIFLPLSRSNTAIQDRRQTQIKTLHAVALFDEGNFDDAINTFIELDINPAKVVALYPDSIAGRLSTPREKWFELHGGQPPPNFIQIESSGATLPHESSNVTAAELPEPTGASPAQVAPGNFRGKWMAGFDRLVPSGAGQKDDDTVSVSGKVKDKPAGGKSL